MSEHQRGRFINGTSLDPRFNNPDTIVYVVKVVTVDGMTVLKFPSYDKHKAFNCAMSLMNSPDMTFVSIGKEQG